MLSPTTLQELQHFVPFLRDVSIFFKVFTIGVNGNIVFWSFPFLCLHISEQFVLYKCYLHQSYKFANNQIPPICSDYLLYLKFLQGVYVPITHHKKPLQATHISCGSCGPLVTAPCVIRERAFTPSIHGDGVDNILWLPECYLPKFRLRQPFCWSFGSRGI